MIYTKGVKIYCKSMQKIFEVQHIAKSDEEANEFCVKHPNMGVIACDSKSGLVFIAKLYGSIGPSSMIPD